MASSGTEDLDTASLQALLGPQLTEEQARLIYEQGADTVVFALLSPPQQGELIQAGLAGRHRQIIECRSILGLVRKVLGPLGPAQVAVGDLLGLR